jgi:hypothetical protein
VVACLTTLKITIPFNRLSDLFRNISIDDGRFDNKPNTIPFFQQIEKAHPQFQIKWVSVPDGAAVEADMTPAEGTVSLDMLPSLEKAVVIISTASPSVL